MMITLDFLSFFLPPLSLPRTRIEGPPAWPVEGEEIPLDS